MEQLSMEQVNQFALKNNVELSNEELTFTYKFIKKNWETILSNPNLLNLDKYMQYYTPENFEKIKQLVKVYYQKYGSYL